MVGTAKRFLTFAIVVIVASFTAAPGSSYAASTTNTSVACVVEEESHAGAAARGDETREPESTQPVATLPDRAKGKGGPKFRATIPVYFHVLSPDGIVANLTQAQIDAQIAVMNQGFRGRLGGADSGFTWVLAGVSRTVNPDWYDAGYGSAAEREMKRALTRGAPHALNIYSTTADVYLGWAFLPGLSASRMYLDGIVIDWESVPGASTRYANRFDLGYTATHEAGHWLGLQHTFAGGCNAKGDLVDDTPAERIPTSECPLGKDTCPEPGLDPIHNFMDYSYDSCYFEFTSGQNLRMQDHFLYFRAG
jgi:pregnancy-associated plasma protein-A